VSHANLARGALAIRAGDLSSAATYARALEEAQCRDVAGLLRGQLLRTRVEPQSGSSETAACLARLRAIAAAQRSKPGMLATDLLTRISETGPIHGEIVLLESGDNYILSQFAEEVVGSLHRLSKEALLVVQGEAERRSTRWVGALRRQAILADDASRAAIELLARIGDPRDAVFLRSLATHDRTLRPTAAAMSRRLAPSVEIADLGIVELSIDRKPIAKRLRRKVLGLLCFVSSRPMMAATRDEALDALWPDLAPTTAVNSLHQTIYFLRRLLEPDYREGLGAGYVQFDGEVLSFDGDLVDSQSRMCWRLIADGQRGDARAIDRLLASYTGKFALDFSYEDWAHAYRENLHAAVLGVVEQRIELLLHAGDSDRAAQAAQTILMVDATADAIELQLLRAYKRGGRHAAAAEQYAHYATMLREELGTDPPLLADI
jgi:DNA-binding SARP family transcriptional activator